MRLTTENPKNNLETAMNYCYIKDKLAHLRHAREGYDIPLHTYTIKLCREQGCTDIPLDCTLTDFMEQINKFIDCPDCPVAQMYHLGAQATDNNARLMDYENACYAEDGIEIITVEEIAEIVKAKQEERFIPPLPCKVGDKANAIVNRPYNGHNLIVTGEVTDIATMIRVRDGFDRYTNFFLSDIGKTVFFTSESAEAELKERGIDE